MLLHLEKYFFLRRKPVTLCIDLCGNLPETGALLRFALRDNQKEISVNVVFVEPTLNRKLFLLFGLPLAVLCLPVRKNAQGDGGKRRTQPAAWRTYRAWLTGRFSQLLAHASSFRQEGVRSTGPVSRRLRGDRHSCVRAVPRLNGHPRGSQFVPYKHTHIQR